MCWSLMKRNSPAVEDAGRKARGDSLRAFPASRSHLSETGGVYRQPIARNPIERNAVSPLLQMENNHRFTEGGAYIYLWRGRGGHKALPFAEYHWLCRRGLFHKLRWSGGPAIRRRRAPAKWETVASAGRATFPPQVRRERLGRGFAALLLIGGMYNDC